VAKGHPQENPAPVVGEKLPAKPPIASLLSKVEFVKVEKNLASLGFFTPSSKRVRSEKAKTITVTKAIDGKRVEAKATIVPAALYGLPITADQDKYLALQKIINDLQQEQRTVENPITFTSAELLRLLGRHRDSGKNYQEIEEWLKVMFSTGIISEGTVYFAGQKRWVKDMFHVFDRAVAVGKELPDGTVADRNYIWLSSWQLENINHNHLLPIDLETYRELKNHIAKALVPLLQIWLYASRDEGAYTKRYEELCQFLNIRRYQHLSDVSRQLKPSLDELQAHGYLSSWSVEKTRDKRALKIVFKHGEKFHRDRRRRLAAGESEPKEPLLVEDQPAIVAVKDAVGPEPAIDEKALGELTRRGVSEKHARKVLATVPLEQAVVDQLEWGDAEIEHAPHKFRNPAGYYVSLIRDNATVPDTFETTRKREERAVAAEAHRVQREAQQRLQDAYSAYQAQEVEHYLAGLAPAVLNERLTREKEALVAEFNNLRHLPDDQLFKLARTKLATTVAKELPLQSFAAFCESQKG
jgi:hypothetical protein